jgi:hypothetical protein
MKNNGYTFPITKEMATAKTTAKISTKSAKTIAKKINRKNFLMSKTLVEKMYLGKKSLNGKFYTKASEEIFKLLKLLEANALSRGLNAEGMELLFSAHMGPNYQRGRRKQHYGTKMKITHIHAVIKPGKVKKVKPVKVEKKKEKPKEVKKEEVKPVAEDKKE